MIKLNRYKISIFSLLILTMLTGLFFTKSNIKSTNGMALSGKTVIIDAGHGGQDPGQPSLYEGLNEADLNIIIVNKLKNYLETAGCYVILTRIDENDLSDKENFNKKVDMNKRKELINNSNATIAISIHQNSFTNSKYKGAQVFYPEGHEESIKLAQNIQNSFKKNLDETNERQIKTEKYYILQKPTIPIVICECGFLTNYEESMNLNNEIYQEKIAWSIYLGICDYFSK